MVRHINIKIHGLVQGVFFRHSAKAKAEELGLVGFARNEPDGSVYIEAEGDEKNLKRFSEWCRGGSPPAAVDRVNFKFADELKHFPDFVIL